MTLALDTGHALYNNILFCLAVDSDDTVKELKNGGVTATLDAGASIGSGTYGKHLSTVENNFNLNGASLSPTIDFSTATHPNMSIFAVYNSISGSGGNAMFLGASSNFPNHRLHSTGAIGLSDANKAANIALGTTNVTSGAHSIVSTRTGETSCELFVDGASEATGAKHTYNGSVALSTLGGFSGQGSVTADFVYIIAFNKILTPTEITDLHNSLDANNQFALLESAVAAVPIGVPTIGSITVGSSTASVPFSYTDGDASGYKYRINGGSVVDSGTTNPIPLSGLTADTTYTVEILAYNATGDAVVWSDAVNFTTGSITATVQLLIDDAVNGLGASLANEAGLTVWVKDVNTDASVLTLTSQIFDANGDLLIDSALLVASTTYRVTIKRSNGEEGTQLVST